MSQVAFYYAFRYILSSLDPGRSQRAESKKAADAKLQRLGLASGSAELLNLTEHEEQISSELILPDDIRETFADIGGLEPIISSLRESVIAPLCLPQLFNPGAAAAAAADGDDYDYGSGGPGSGSAGPGLLGAPKGVLLYGPPGTGKTMLAKALAKESGATFINMRVSTLTNKWFGESNKLVAALFSLARKLQPSIIFIDEIDSFLRERGAGDHEVTAMMKAEFMSLWDGLTSGADRIMVLGATNRPNDIDAAILRRMPKRYAVTLPDAQQRRKILGLLLAPENHVTLDPAFALDALVAQTQGMSGSDLKELCRNAAMVPVREFMQSDAGKAHLENTVRANRERHGGGGGRAPKRGHGAAAAGGGGASSSRILTRALRNSDFFLNDSAATPLQSQMRVRAAAAAPPTESLD